MVSKYVSIKKAPAHDVDARHSPRFARWMLATYLHGSKSFELPIKYDIQENHIHLGVSWDSFIITLSSLEEVEHSGENTEKELYN